jgi:hypothetical protein
LFLSGLLLSACSDSKSSDESDSEERVTDEDDEDRSTTESGKTGSVKNDAGKADGGQKDSGEPASSSDKPDTSDGEPSAECGDLTWAKYGKNFFTGSTSTSGKCAFCHGEATPDNAMVGLTSEADVIEHKAAIIDYVVEASLNDADKCAKKGGLKAESQKKLATYINSCLPEE